MLGDVIDMYQKNSYVFVPLEQAIKHKAPSVESIPEHIDTSADPLIKPEVDKETSKPVDSTMAPVENNSQDNSKEEDPTKAVDAVPAIPLDPQNDEIDEGLKTEPQSPSAVLDVDDNQESRLYAALITLSKCFG